MRLLRTEIRNFKLLDDVALDFSADPERPLTVIRAENGSGKTSLLYALLWAFYGSRGLPDHARDLRLTSSAVPTSTPTDVQVMVLFEHTDDSGSTTKYRLIRTVTETPKDGDSVDRQPDRLRLLKITPAGEEDIQAAEALVGKLVPIRLRNVFFTNGDDVQTFISGKVSTQQRQDQVHKAVRSLLGLDALRTAAEDIEDSFKSLRRKVARSGGSDIQEAEEALEKTDEAIDSFHQQLETLQDQLASMADQKEKWDKELQAIHGIGDLDDLNDRIQSTEADIQRLQLDRARALSRMREALRSETFSWAFLAEHLQRGTKLLVDLADQRVIPGISVEVLTDRLDLGECICGEPLVPGSNHRHQVEQLREDQLHISENRQRLTALLHTARQSDAAEAGRAERNEASQSMRRALLEEFTNAVDALRKKGIHVEQLKERRRQIDESRVRDLTEKIDHVEKRIGDANATVGKTEAELTRLSELREEQDRRRRDAEKKAKVNTSLAIRRDVAEDLLDLARGSLGVLENDYVQQVSDRMQEIFIHIVGNNPELQGNVFSGVHISDSFDIVVDTQHDRTLDTDFELNGASQRALTLSFIWALMEVSGTTAPRIIDTPLGMVAGGVKRRLVDAITKPSTNDLPDFQVVLLLTRSEIRDIEELLDGRAGLIQTMSCSKDYPTDLVHNWGVDHPTIRVCTCTHRQACRICARNYDQQHGLSFRDEEAILL